MATAGNISNYFPLNPSTSQHLNASTINRQLITNNGNTPRFLQLPLDADRQIDAQSVMKCKLMLIGLLFLAGCAGDKKFTQIKPGMTKQQVMAIVGQPNGFKMEKDGEVMRYSDNNRYVRLRNGRVVECGEE